MEKQALIAKLKTIVEPYIQDEDAFKSLSENTDFVKDLKIKQEAEEKKYAESKKTFQKNQFQIYL